MPTIEPRAVLWDMDGTLLDSAEYHWLTWQEVLTPEGHELTRERFSSTFGRRNQAVLRDLLGPDIPESEMTRIETTKEARYRELVRTGGIEPLPGVVDWLTRLRDAGWRQAIASSAPRLNIDTILETLGLAPMIDGIAGSEDVTRGKPDPQIFLVAAAKLEVPPPRCVVVEDAHAGVEAARQAGMRCIGVGPSHATLSADLTVPSLDALPSDAFDRLVPPR
jgi:beta-phosphoglucomutase